MSNLIDIQQKLKNIPGDQFELLCDAYLACKGYKKPYPYGMSFGTPKTCIGNPDTYFKTRKGKYILAMYTAQDKGFYKKAIKDIDKCLNRKLVDIPKKDISEIIYCHNNTRVSVGDDHKLHEYCKAKRVKLTIIGPGEIASDIYVHYPTLARDFLHLKMDTDQIHTIQDFIKQHDKLAINSPLDTNFMFRESELNEANISLKTNNVLIISGPAGIGKTRFALEVCRHYEKKKYTTLCVKSNQLEIFEDLKSSISLGNKFLFLIDDGNDLPQIKLFLDLLSNDEIKLVITVRDYARNDLLKTVSFHTIPKIIVLKPFSSAQIADLVKKQYKITNNLYFDRIEEIAQGNTRLAFLAATIANKTHSLKALNDVTHLYLNYYENQLNKIIDPQLQLSAGILGFLQSVRTDDIPRLSDFLLSFGLTVQQFITSIKTLNDMEIADYQLEKAAKFSDQCFSNFLVYYVFVDRKIVPLHKIIKEGFIHYQRSTINSCQMLVSIFGSTLTDEYITSEVNAVWNDFQSSGQYFDQFFKSFHAFKPSETLILLQSKIEKHPYNRSKPADFDLSTKSNSTEDETLQILQDYANSSEYQNAIGLIIEYFYKRPDLFREIYNVFTISFGITQFSPSISYRIQSYLLDSLFMSANRRPTIANRLMYVNVASHYLNFVFQHNEYKMDNVFEMQTITINDSEAAINLRKCIINNLITLYKSNQCKAEIEKCLFDYSPNKYYDSCKQIIQNDLLLFEHIFNHFSVNNPYHCIIVLKYSGYFKSLGLTYNRHFYQLQNSNYAKIFSVLNIDVLSKLNKKGDINYRYFQSRIKKVYQAADEKLLKQTIILCTLLENINEYVYPVSNGLQQLFEYYKNDNQKLITLTKLYILNNTPMNIHPKTIFDHLFSIMDKESVKSLVFSNNYTYQSVWQWYYFLELPNSSIDSSSICAIHKFFSKPSKAIKSSYTLLIDGFSKYCSVQNSIISDICKLIIKHFDEAPFISSQYLCELINDYKLQNNFTKDFIYNNLDLYEMIYLKMLNNPNFGDFDGSLLAYTLSIDPTFCIKYIQKVHMLLNHVYHFDNQYCSRLAKAWSNDNYSTIFTTSFKFIKNKIADHYSINIINLMDSSDQTIINNQNDWIISTIKSNSKNKYAMMLLFDMFRNLSTDRKLYFIKYYLSLNNNVNDFKQLALHPYSMDISDNNGPIEIQKRIDFLKQIISLIPDINYTKHRLYLSQCIDQLQEDMKNEETRIILDSFSFDGF